MPVHRTCLQCGHAFSATPSAVKKGRRFCSPACHYAWSRGRPTAKRRHHPKPCTVCGRVFRNSHAKTLTCSKPCGYEQKFRNYMARAEATAGEPIGLAIRQRLDAGTSVRAIVRELGLADNRQLHRIMARFDIPIPTRSEAV